MFYWMPAPGLPLAATLSQTGNFTTRSGDRIFSFCALATFDFCSGALSSHFFIFADKTLFPSCSVVSADARTGPGPAGSSRHPVTARPQIRSGEVPCVLANVELALRHLCWCYAQRVFSCELGKQRFATKCSSIVVRLNQIWLYLKLERYYASSTNKVHSVASRKNCFNGSDLLAGMFPNHPCIWQELYQLYINCTYGALNLL